MLWTTSVAVLPQGFAFDCQFVEAKESNMFFYFWEITVWIEPKKKKKYKSIIHYDIRNMDKQILIMNKLYSTPLFSKIEVNLDLAYPVQDLNFLLPFM